MKYIYIIHIIYIDYTRLLLAISIANAYCLQGVLFSIAAVVKSFFAKRRCFVGKKFCWTWQLSGFTSDTHVGLLASGSVRHGIGLALLQAHTQAERPGRPGF